MSDPRDTILLKLGGSVITYKSETPPKVNTNAVQRIANELQGITEPAIIVLGGGAHGHQAASSFGYGNPETPPRRLLLGIPKIRHNMNELASTVESIMNNNGISSVVISPFMFSLLDSGRIISFPYDIISKTIEAGHNIITHGDVCYDTRFGASILSGDTIMTYLARKLQIKKILIGTDVDGVLDEDPKKNPQAKIIPIISKSNKESVLSMTGPSGSTDVTGGMAKKIGDIFLIAGSGIEATIFNLTIPNRLTDLLCGRQIPCTKIIV